MTTCKVTECNGSPDGYRVSERVPALTGEKGICKQWKHCGSFPWCCKEWKEGNMN